VQAVRNEQKAKEVATAVDAVSEAARSIGSAQEDASALSGAALQAAAALSSLNGTAGNQTGLQAGEEERRQDAGNKQDRDHKHAESKSFALGGLCDLFLAGFDRLLSQMAAVKFANCQLEGRFWVMCSTYVVNRNRGFGVLWCLVFLSMQLYAA